MHAVIVLSPVFILRTMKDWFQKDWFFCWKSIERIRYCYAFHCFCCISTIFPLYAHRWCQQLVLPIITGVDWTMCEPATVAVLSAGQKPLIHEIWIITRSWLIRLVVVRNRWAEELVVDDRETVPWGPGSQVLVHFGQNATSEKTISASNPRKNHSYKNQCQAHLVSRRLSSKT